MYGAKEIKFPFDVYSDSSCSDIVYHQDVWSTIEDVTTVYVKPDLATGDYQINYRVIAVNCPQYANGQYIINNHEQENANTDLTNYIATATSTLHVRHAISQLTVQMPTGTPQSTSAFGIASPKGYTWDIALSGYEDAAEYTLTPVYTYVNGTVEKPAYVFYNLTVAGQTRYMVQIGSTTDANHINELRVYPVVIMQSME